MCAIDAVFGVKSSAGRGTLVSKHAVDVDVEVAGGRVIDAVEAKPSVVNVGGQGRMKFGDGPVIIGLLGEQKIRSGRTIKNLVDRLAVVRGQNHDIGLKLSRAGGIIVVDADFNAVAKRAGRSHLKMVHAVGAVKGEIA